MNREAFEKWNHERDSNTLTKLNTGEYANAFTAACWAAWQAATAAAVPPGYVVVPVEPTQEMLRAMTDPFIAINGDNRAAFYQAYRTMLEAARKDIA